ncbi:hypothetical protein BVRB_6g140980 [Beta vulgaris subsp. vulgaris]|nr:hypothetical protein BVRB_6g140980 [Beta vulgaris subsp. vulgaris]
MDDIERVSQQLNANMKHSFGDPPTQPKKPKGTPRAYLGRAWSQGDGNDLEQHITPIEAGMTWAVGKRRRAKGGFLGAESILKQIVDGPSKRHVGFISSGPPARGHSEIQNEKGENIGEITTRGFSPFLKKNITMGYVKSGNHKAGTNANIVVRGKPYGGVITKMPFVPTKYYMQLSENSYPPGSLFCYKA